MTLEAKAGALECVEPHRIAGAGVGENPTIPWSSGDPFEIGDRYGAALCEYVRRTQNAYGQSYSQIDDVLTHGVSVARGNDHG